MTPPRRLHAGPAPSVPLALHVMMQEIHHRQPKLQQQMPQPLTDRGGRRRRGRHGGRGRGRGRKCLQPRNYRRDQSDDLLQSTRKRKPSDEGREMSRFYLPSFLQDPWKALEAGGDVDRWEEMDPRQVGSCPVDDGHGRVLFQPEFLKDPWAR